MKYHLVRVCGYVRVDGFEIIVRSPDLVGHKRRSQDTAWKCVREALHLASDRFLGIHSVLIDGAADLVRDVNDPAESNGFVSELHGRAIEHHCPIDVVIHFNPGSDKTRGHLGSQLERKAETNLRLDKLNGVTTIWSDKQRRAPIPKGTGPCFRWSDEAGMHVSVESLQSAADKEKREMMKHWPMTFSANGPPCRTPIL